MNVTVDSGLTATAGSFQGPAASTLAGNKIAVLGGGTFNLNGTNNLVTGSADNNQSAGVTVNGGSTLNVTETLYAMSPSAVNRAHFTNLVGNSSANNTVNISGSGVATTGAWTVGGGTFGGNSVSLSAPGTATVPTLKMVGNGMQLNLGVSSSNNSFNMSNGAVLTVAAGGGTSTWTIGTNAGANGNAITVSGSGTSLNRSGAGGSFINVGGAGDNNTLTVQSGGTLNSNRFAAGANGGDNNVATVTGSGSLLFSSGGAGGWFEVGVLAASVSNAVKVENGGKANVSGSGTSRVFGVGSVATADSNFIRVTGTGSTMNMNMGLPLGIGVKATGTAAAVGGNSNSLQVYDGGSFLSVAPIYVGSSVDTGGTESTNNSLSIGNGTSNIATVTVGASAAQFNAAAGYNGVYTVPGTTTAVAVQTSSYAVPTTGSLTTQGVLLNGATSSLNFNNGRLVAGSTGTLVSGAGKVNLVGDTYVSSASGTNTISSEITGSGDFTKEGAGTIDLTFANTYTGDTIIAANGGILQMTNAYLADAAAVRLFSGGKLNLNTIGASDTIGALYFNGVQQAGGTWGSTASLATNTNDTYFEGTGMLLVAAIPEPATALLGGLGMLTLLRRRRSA